LTIPEDRKYTTTHEWAAAEGEVARVGITDYAQEQLGDIVFLELPAPGTAVTRGEACGVIESVKAVEDLRAPLTGEIVQANDELSDRPETINQDPYGQGWIVTIRPSDPQELAELLDAPAYAKLCEEASTA
jgi:glycine cleavage system H protein